MRALPVAMALALCAGTAAAQAPPPASREEIAALATRPFAWTDALETRGNAGPTQVKTNISNSAVRQAWIDTLADMVKRSYTPYGALPQAFRNINPYRTGMTDYRPLEYGMTFVMQDPTIKAGKITRSPIPSLSVIYAYANSLSGAEGAWELNTPTQFYFTMRFEPDGTLVDPKERAADGPDIAAIKRAVGRDCIVMTMNGGYIVLMIPGGRLPVVPVTIGEALDAAEAGIRRRQAGSEPADAGTYAARMAGVARSRAMHAHELGRPARVRDYQFSHGSFQNEWDPFNGTRGDILWPLYKVDPAVYARAASGGPQWLAFGFPRLKYNKMPRDQAIYDAMTRRFDWGSAYDAVFAPGATPASAKAAYRPRTAP
jgi:hypothetical protein